MFHEYEAMKLCFGGKHRAKFSGVLIISFAAVADIKNCETLFPFIFQPNILLLWFYTENVMLTEMCVFDALEYFLKNIICKDNDNSNDDNMMHTKERRLKKRSNDPSLRLISLSETRV